MLLLQESLNVAADIPIPVGKVINQIICLKNPQQSYALYLPSYYIEDKKWPVIFIFDPAGRGAVPVNIFSGGAEKYGYILICSNNSRNGPIKINLKAMENIWGDSIRRYSLNLDRVYFAGFSGGARMATVLSVHYRNAAGLIACGAGLSKNLTAEQFHNKDFFAIVGLRDFNLKEMIKLRNSFRNLGIDHFLEITPDIHDWPAKDACLLAVEYLEIKNIKKKLKKSSTPSNNKVKKMVNSIMQHYLKTGTEKEQSGDLYSAVEFYKYGKALFQGLSEVNIFDQKIKQLTRNPLYFQSRQSFEESIVKESSYILEAKKKFRKVAQTPVVLNLDQVYSDLKLDELGILTGDPDIYKKTMGLRTLYDIAWGASYNGRSYYLKKNYQKAITFYLIAAKADNKNPYHCYNLASLYSLTNTEDKAIFYLESAIKKGFKNLGYLKKDRSFDWLRDREQFKEILQNLETGKK